MREAQVIGLDIGGSKTLAGLVTRAGEVGSTRQVETAPTPAAILVAARSLCQSLLKEAKAPVVGIGIGSAGIIDTEAGRVVFANENMPGWSGTRLDDLEIGGGLPISAENDVRALAYGEALVGAGADFDSLLCVAVGTGIGGALIQNGEVWHGADYSGGEIGYLVVDWERGEPVILDQYASGPAIERAYQRASARETRLPLPEVGQLAAGGDNLAMQAIVTGARKLGAILAGCATAINPAAVIVGGGVPQLGALWWAPLEAAFRASLPPPVAATPLLPATLGAKAVMLGAAMLAWRKVDA